MSGRKKAPRPKVAPEAPRASVPKSRDRRWIVLAGCVALVVAAVAFFFAFGSSHDSSDKSSNKDSLVAAGYVNPSECTSCHSDIAKTYSKTGMGRSLYRPSAANTIEDYSKQNTLHHELSGLTYTMVERDGKLYQRRSERGFEGKEDAVQEEQVDYIVGSGNHARNYLHQLPTGELIELPLSWYTEKNGYWAMSPGYDRRDQDDFGRTVPRECLYCHTGYPLLDSDLKTADLPIFGKELPQGIDCQRCHGPGKAHVEAASASHPSEEKVRSTIVNPGKLSRERQLETCYQCHLETSSSHIPNEVRNFERSVYSFRPGTPLGEYKRLFDEISVPSQDGNQQSDKFEIAHAGYRLQMSACFRNSKMTCLTCHDPHDIPRGQEAVQHYDEVCQSCHQGTKHTVALPTASTCISCHMPLRRTDDAVHVVMTDHYIQRYKRAGDLLAPRPEKVAVQKGLGVKQYYPVPQDNAQDELYLAVAQVQDGSHLKESVAHLRDLIGKDNPPQAEFYFELGRGYYKLSNQTEAIQWLEEALKRKPDDRPAIKQITLAFFTTNQTQQAIDLLQKAVNQPPADDLLYTNLGNAYLRLGQAEQAQTALLKALELNPENGDAQNLLGLIALRQNNRAEAEAQFRSAIQSKPSLSEARNNLGNLLAGTRRPAEAAFQFEKAIEIDPSYADAHRGYGLMLALNKQFDKAIAELNRATALAPNAAQGHVDLADVLSATGHSATAQAEYEKAVQLNPNAYDAQLNLGMLLAHAGRMSEARPHWQKATESPDPEVRQAAQSALLGQSN